MTFKGVTNAHTSESCLGSSFVHLKCEGKNGWEGYVGIFLKIFSHTAKDSLNSLDM